jgi:hypothetical protein
MRLKTKLVRKDLKTVYALQQEQNAVIEAVAGVLARGFWGRMKWLILGR